jgi:hypothetical protein
LLEQKSNNVFVITHGGGDNQNNNNNCQPKLKTETNIRQSAARAKQWIYKTEAVVVLAVVD